MKNYVQAGVMLSLLAPYAVAAGDGMLVGSIFSVAVNDAANGAAVEGCTQGVYTLPKTSAQAWAVGDKIYWDNALKVCTTVSVDTVLIGAAMEAAANPSATGNVRLNGVVA